MSEQDHTEFDAPAEVSTNTADVRDAIERAREAGKQPTPAQGDVTTGEELEPSAEQSVSEAVVQESETHPTIQETVTMPSAGEEVTPVEPEELQPVGDVPVAQPQEHITISADHPMAALYMQQPDPPKRRSNRLAGFFISLLATLGFAVVYAGGLALWLAPKYPPSTFLQEGLYPYLVSLSFVIPVVAFFVMLVAYVLIFNRTGWWVYVIFGTVIAVAVWGGAAVGLSMSPQLAAAGESAQHNIRLFMQFLITVPALIAAVAAREVSIWFGAWIGSRGRRVKFRNAEEQAQYERKLAELKAPQQP